MAKVLQLISQIMFLTLFIIFMIIGKVQLWMVIFIAGIIIALFFGRFYCGWICPINTVMKIVAKLKERFSIKSFNSPSFLTKSFVRYIVLLLFLIIFIFVMFTGKRLPVLPFLFTFGIVISVFYSESLWHRYICPYGTILSIAGSKSKHYLKINTDNCISCGICKKVCPALAIDKNDAYSINKSFCLLCLECTRKCPKNTIHYNI